MQLDAPGSAQRVTHRPSGTAAARQARFRPWEQQDLLHRLHTFKTRTWFGKPTQINALACARHGWINRGPDRLACEFCGEHLDLPIRPKWSVKDIDKAADDYSKKLASGHDESCPWRDTVCDTSLGRFPKLPARDVYLNYSRRYACLNQLSAVPPVDSKALSVIQQPHRNQLIAVFQKQLQGRQSSLQPPQSAPPDTVNDSLTQHTAEHGTDGFSQRACWLAVCGWQPHFITKPPTSSDPETGVNNPDSQQQAVSVAEGTCEMKSAALACSMCGARVGLWGFDQQPDSSALADVEMLEAADKAASPAQPAGRKPVSRKSSVLVDLSRTIAGGTLTQPANSPGNPENPAVAQAAPFGSRIHAPAFGSGSFTPGSNLAAAASANDAPQAAASHSGDLATKGPFGSDPLAPFGQALPAPAFGSASVTPAFGSQPVAAAPAFGAGLQPPAFGSGSRLVVAPGTEAAFGSAPPAGLSQSALVLNPTAAGHPADTTASEMAGPAKSVAHQVGALVGSIEGSGAATASGDGPFGGRAGLPAFGMAVLRSLPASRSPSFHASRSNSAIPAASSPSADASPAVPTPTGTQVQGALTGGKRKRGPEAGLAELADQAGPSQPSKQARTEVGSTQEQEQQQLSFRVLGHHKPFCPWVARDPNDSAVCGWQWCLESLAAHWNGDSSAPKQSVQAPSERLRKALAAIGK